MSSHVVTVAFVGTALFVFGGPIATGYWVYRDAAVRGSRRARAWGVGTALFVIPVLPLYLVVRRRRLDARREWTARDRTAGVVAAAVLTAWFVATIVAPPDPVAQLLWAVPAASAVGVLAVAVARKQVSVHGPTQ